MALIDGDDGSWGDCYPYEHFNRIKNNWSQDAPQENLGNPQPGMIVSDSTDDILYHKLVAAGFNQIVQAEFVLVGDGEVLCGDGEILTCGS